jgi:hypothetical protein
MDIKIAVGLIAMGALGRSLGYAFRVDPKHLDHVRPGRRLHDGSL